MELLALFVAALTLSAVRCAVYIDEDCYIYPVYPVQYEITLTPYMVGDHFYYEGDVTITAISTVNGLRRIELDSKDLDIHDDSVSVHIDGRNIVDLNRPFSVDRRREKVIINLTEGLRIYNGYKGTLGNKHQYSIKLKFRGNINRDDSGLFATPYRELNRQKWLISTRLAPDNARRVFPCFDNPRMEAGFVLRVYRPARLPTALAISQEQRRHEISSHTLVEYAPSAQIPCYKLGLHISEFVPHQPSSGYQCPLVVWTRPEERTSYQVTQTFGCRVLGAIGAYMNSSRHITTGAINVVAIPNYSRGYEKGAWNLLNVGEHKFLVDEEQVSAQQKEQIELELARQLARVWLGNPDESSRTRWKQEWFKEGVATYFSQYLSVWGDVYQRGSDALGLQTMFEAMALDSNSNRPLVAFNITSGDTLKKEEEDLITMKTSSILRMIEHWIGSDAFHKIVRDFLVSWQGKTISIQDFGDYLQRMAINCEFFKGYTINNIIRSWTDQPGYPVIEVTVYRDRNVIALSQKPFDLHGRPQTNSHSSYLIPISYSTQFTDKCIDCLQPKFIISRPNYMLHENLNGGWIILNRKASGYYRVNYDIENWNLIIKTLKSADRNRIGVANRAQIVNDAFALHASGLLDQHLATGILSSLMLEEEPLVWTAAFQGYELLKQAPFMTKKSYDFWKVFMSEQVSKIYWKLKSGGRTDLQSRVFRSKVVDFACSVDLSTCIDNMNSLPLTKSGQTNEADLRRAYYYVKCQRHDTWATIRQSLESRGANEREDILNAKKKADHVRIFYEKLDVGPADIIMLNPIPPTENCSSTQNLTSGAQSPVFMYIHGILAVVLAVYAVS